MKYVFAALVAAGLMGGVAVAERDRILPETSGNKTASCVQGDNNYCGGLETKDEKARRAPQNPAIVTDKERKKRLRGYDTSSNSEDETDSIPFPRAP